MLEYKITDTTWRETYASREGAYFNARGVSLMWRSRIKWWLTIQNEALLCTSQCNAPSPLPLPSPLGLPASGRDIAGNLQKFGFSADIRDDFMRFTHYWLANLQKDKKVRFWTYCWEKLWEMGKKPWDVTNFQAEGHEVGIMGIQWWIQERGPGSPPLPYF